MLKRFSLNKHRSSPRTHRIIQRNGARIPVTRTGVKRFTTRDVYVHTLNSSWLYIIIASLCVYLSLNILFANFYLLIPDSIENAEPGSFSDAFFFSVQTMSTIGYGKMVPNGLVANILVTIEALIGMGGLAVATGILFAKLSKPTARVLFSNVAVISVHDGVKSFVFRLANERSSRIVDPQIKVVLVKDEITTEGRKTRRFHDLKLVRDSSPLLLLSWSVYHPIDQDSPLYGVTEVSLKETNTEIIVSLTGLDETFAQIVYAQHSYIAEEILCDHYFVDIIHRDNTGRVHVDYTRFHDVISVSDAHPA